MSFLTLLLSRFFHEENYDGHKKTNITLSNTPMYLLVVLSLLVVVALDESFYTTKASPLPECWIKETLIVSGHTFHDLTFRRRIDSQKLKQK